jgi:putative addiction module component (TIGR02574 family)
MKSSIKIANYSQLSIPEKIIMVEKLWDDIAKTGTDDTPVPQTHKEELFRRHERYVKNPGRVLTVKELQNRIGYAK